MKSHIKEFWDKKIIGWEQDKYERQKKIDVNVSLKERLKIAGRILQSGLVGSKIVELGCGSGRLLPIIAKLPHIHYVGIDVSPVAIAEAQKRAKELGIEERVNLIAGSIVDHSFEKVDLVFSLGLLDWLSDEEMNLMIKNVRAPHFFHSFSEQRPSLSQFLHRLYVFSFYGHKDPSYVPRYYTDEEMFGLLRGENVKFYRSKKLSFGTFCYDLPFDLETI